MVTEKETDLDPAEVAGAQEEKRPKKPKGPRKKYVRAYFAYIWSLRGWRRVLAVLATFIVIGFFLIYVSAIIQYEPWYKNEFQDDIERDPQWIEVAANPIEFNGYASEGETWTQQWNFPTDDDRGRYVGGFTIFVVWIDDARTERDSFQYTVLKPDGDQAIAGYGDSGTMTLPFQTNNTNINHVENYQGWTVMVTCMSAKDGYIGPGGVLRIPDDGNDFNVRFEWTYWIEHDPDWE